MLGNIENVKREIFSLGNSVKVYNIVNFGFKSKDENKLEPLYEQSYNSTKYSDKDVLSNLIIRSNNYLVFSYKSSESGEFVNEDIYISYPNINIFKDYLNTVVSDLYKNEKSYYTKKSVTETGDEKIFESSEFAQGKTFAIFPAKIERNETLVNGVIMCLNSEECYVEIDIDTLATLAEVINNFDLLNQSGITMLMALIYSNGDNDTSSSFSNNRFKRTSSPKKLKEKKIFNRSEDSDDDEEEDDEEETVIKKPSSKKIIKKPNKNVVEEETNDEDESDDDEVPVKKTSSKKKTVSTKKKSSDDTIMSLEDAIKLSEEDIDLDDLGELD